jgi:TRAP-type C4-dicarboxylate transport system permease small subunit
MWSRGWLHIVPNCFVAWSIDNRHPLGLTMLLRGGMFRDFTARLVDMLLAVAALIIFLLGFLVVADVGRRVLFNSPIKGTPEIVSMAIVIVCFLIAAQAVRSGGMIRTDVLIDMFGKSGHEFANLLSGLLGAAFFGLIVWGSYEPALHAWTSSEFEGEGALRVPVWPARYVVMLGSGLVTLIYLGQAIAAAKALFYRRAPR